MLSCYDKPFVSVFKSRNLTTIILCQYVSAATISLPLSKSKHPDKTKVWIKTFISSKVTTQRIPYNGIRYFPEDFMDFLANCRYFYTFLIAALVPSITHSMMVSNQLFMYFVTRLLNSTILKPQLCAVILLYFFLLLIFLLRHKIKIISTEQQQ